uniref:Cytochrome c oxidase subunit 6b-1-like n=1 Tax=Davidia involucrata TaxID=16924 RepID=A0A5B7C310_DAVIN
MGEVDSGKTSTLAEQYLLKEKEEKLDVGKKPAEETEVKNPVNSASEEVVTRKTEETPVAAAEESSKASNTAAEESNEATPSAGEGVGEAAPAAAEESSESTEQANSGDEEVVEQTPEIKLETAPADFRFPTTNQSRHCFTRYIEYHRCIAAKGEGAPECDKFAKYYRSLCPGEWIDRWNEQRENGSFPGPL